MLFDVLDIKGQKKSQVNLSDEIFGVPIKTHLIYDAVRYQMAKQRRGTASTKSRSEVRGGGTKPWRQKGTGRARAGSIRSPLWVGGGVVFGPRPRDFSIKINKKARKGALKSAISFKVQNQDLILLDTSDLDDIKTRSMSEMLKNLGISKGKKVLILTGSDHENMKIATRNIYNVNMFDLNGLNVYDIIWHQKLIIIISALPMLEELLAS